MPKRRLSSDFGDDPIQKIRKVDNQQMKHHANFTETVSSLRQCSVSHSPNEVEPRMQPSMSEEVEWSRIEDLTRYDEPVDYSQRDADIEPEESDDEPEDDCDYGDSDDDDSSEALKEALAEIEELDNLIERKTVSITYWKNWTRDLRKDNMRLEREVKVLKAKLEAINKKPT
ncbi:uncharacterized protein BKA55DRAFT_539815 [Fusarium redolens]|uniref:Uncharacterized protein n=1 Tax=Fusarium redolens TaxID=48865 RepID=A0A9P9KES2_FUSRE|nr:uncharacterized protein BKA55DRAFT_539815 [Fusarium redolens]KAH7250259.1 hypothetical protein BKA55DRAFT_539815 [Fusarium redolens]